MKRVALLALTMLGCTTMRPIKHPANYIEAVRPKLVRVTRTDGTQVNVTGAHMEGDTLVGFVERRGGVMGEFTEIPLSDVSGVEAQQYASGKTALAVAAVLVGWAAITYGVIKFVEAHP